MAFTPQADTSAAAAAGLMSYQHSAKTATSRLVQAAG
jgi:hypothetical protein